MYIFAWDENKNELNKNKHGVSVIRIISARKATRTEHDNYERSLDL